MAAAEERRRELYGLLGDLPPRSGPPVVQVIGEEPREDFVLERLVLDLNGLEPVPAYFVRPREAVGPLPVTFWRKRLGGVTTCGFCIFTTAIASDT